LAPVQSAAEIHSDPQVVANRFIQEVSYPDGPVSLVVPPILFDEDPGVVAPAPNFFEHTDEVLSEIGFDSQALEKLRNDGAIG
jgi:crotonobetainyl-CoA:carnitine CoA-transferase CaiB-like acyl-CoA transferase